MTKLHIVTVATEIKYYMKYLIETIKTNGGELVILGFGEKWQGFNWRNKLILNYISNLDDDDILCFIDGYDVLCVKNLDSLVDKFEFIKNREKCKIIVGYENILSIGNKIGNFMIFNSTINAGTYICKIKDLKEIITSILKINQLDDSDDQVLLIKYAKNNPKNVYSDIGSELFLTLIDSCNQINPSNIIIDNKIIYNNNNPYFVHGAANTCMDDLVIRMDLEKKINVCNNYKSDIHKKTFYYTFYLIDLYGIYILIITLLLIFIFKNK
jgi:hypothetical protein